MQNVLQYWIAGPCITIVEINQPRTSTDVAGGVLNNLLIFQWADPKGRVRAEHRVNPFGYASPGERVARLQFNPKPVREAAPKRLHVLSRIVHDAPRHRAGWKPREIARFVPLKKNICDGDSSLSLSLSLSSCYSQRCENVSANEPTKRAGSAPLPWLDIM